MVSGRGLESTTYFPEKRTRAGAAAGSSSSGAFPAASPLVQRPSKPPHGLGREKTFLHERSESLVGAEAQVGA